MTPRIVVVLLDDREILERVENETFENDMLFLERLRIEGMNDQVLDNLTTTFIGYVTILN